jgi:hypothetical protein
MNGISKSQDIVQQSHMAFRDSPAESVPQKREGQRE